MSSSTTAGVPADANAAVSREGIDFASAKNFWQTRAARSQSRTDLDGPPPMVTTTVSAATSASPPIRTFTSTTTTTTATATPPDAPSTPLENFPGEPDEPVEAKPPSAAPASTSTAAPLVVPPPSALTRMTSFGSKFFSVANTSTASNSTSNSVEKKETDTSPKPAPQLPDMSGWKDKMKMNRQMNFSFKDLSTSLKTSLSSAAAVTVADPEKVAMARNNIQRPTQKNARKFSSATMAMAAMVPKATAFGELVVAEVLAAKELSAADYFQGESDPYIIVRFQDSERRTTIVKNTKSPVFNERFVFYTPSNLGSPSEPSEPGLVSVLVMNKNLVMSDLHLGEVHIALDVPLQAAFDEWYPLVKENGEQQGYVRVGVRRLALESADQLQAAQALAATNQSLTDDDLAAYGAMLPELWAGFAEAAEPLEEKASQADVLATKLNDLSRRFIGIELTSTELTADGKRRDIF